MCETMNKGTCFRRCLFLVEMRGIDSRRELRAVVFAVTTVHRTVALYRSYFDPPLSFLQKNKQKRSTRFSASTSLWWR